MNIIQQLMQQLQGDNNLLAPIIITPEAHSAHDTLCAMFDSLSTGVVHDFITEHVKYSVQVLAKVEYGQLVPHNLSPFTHSEMISNNAGVYLIQGRDNVDQYIGSAMNFSNRIGMHANSILLGYSPNRYHLALLAKSQVTEIQWGYIYSTVDYLGLFREIYGNINISLGEVKFLQAISEYLPRLLEQSLVTEFSPTLNNLSNNIRFSITDWDPSLLLEYFTKFDASQPVEIRNSVGDVLATPLSFEEAMNILKCNSHKVRRYLNNATGFMSVVFGCRVTINLIGDKLIPQLKLPGGPLTELGGYVIWAFYPDKRKFLGPFTSLVEAQTVLFPVANYTAPRVDTFRRVDYLMRYRNLEHIVNTEKGQFYIANNPIKQPSVKSPIKSLPKSPWSR